MSAALKTERTRLRAGRGQIKAVTQTTPAPAKASASHPSSKGRKVLSVIRGGRGQSRVVTQKELAPADTSAGRIASVTHFSSARSGAGSHGVDKSGGRMVSVTRASDATSGKRGRKPRSPNSFDGQAQDAIQGRAAIDGPDLVSAPDKSRSDAGASGHHQCVTQRTFAGRVKSPSSRKGGVAGRARLDAQSNGASHDKSLRKKGAADQFGGDIHISSVSRKLSLSSSNGGARGQLVTVTQEIGAPRKTSASNGGVAGRVSADTLMNVANHDKRRSRKAEAGAGPNADDTHGRSASPTTSPRKRGRIGQGETANHTGNADPELSSPQGGPTDRGAKGTLTPRQSVPLDPNALMKSIALLHSEHRGLQRAVGDMSRRIKADERWNAVNRVRAADGVGWKGKKFPAVTDDDVITIMQTRARYYEGHDALEKLRKTCFDELMHWVKQLPVADAIAKKAFPGFALPSLAAVVGEAGNLSNYSNPAKLWKRFSLHVINGAASKKIKGDGAKGQAFVPHRRAEMHVIGENLVRSRGPYADLYRTRKAYELEKLKAAGIRVLPQARIPKGSRLMMSEGQVHKRALRYIEKRLLRDLWRMWRDAA